MKISRILASFVAVFVGALMSSASFSESPLPDTIPSNISVPSNVHIEVSPTQIQAVPATVQKSSNRIWNLQDADILSVINEVSQETGKNFVVDPRVSGKITLVSSKPLKQKELYQVFLSILGLLGYSAIPSGNVVKIVPNMESGEQTTPVLMRKSDNVKGEEVVVRVIPLENVSATQLIPVLRPMLPQWSNISAYTPGNVLILLGRASNLDRIYNIVQDVDKASSNGIQMIPLKHASAAQVATVLNNLQAAARAAGESPAVSIAVDERSNSILLGGPKAMRLRMRVIISQLDEPSTTPAGNTEVVYLRYLEAKTFAPLLGKIAQNIMGKDNNARNDVGSASAPAASGAAAATGGAPKEITVNSTYIQAEPSTNAVIITAPPTLMVALKAVISKLDIRPAQVLVEAIIAEVDEGYLQSLGIQWGSVTPVGFQPSANITPIDFPNFGAGVVGILPHVQIKAVMSLLQNSGGVNILSTPQIVVLDNQKATIEIGQDVPVQTGSYATTSGVQTPTPFTTNSYKPVTLKLEVTPQINLGCSVRLRLNLKNDTLQNPQNPTLTPLINTSKITNSVIINNDDVLVLGGLISNTNNENVNKVPVLGSLPLLGPLLFTQKTVDQHKKNLMVFIKPIIMNTGDESMFITHMKYDQVRHIQANYTDELATLGEKRMENSLPPWKNTQDLPKPFESDR